MSDLVSGVLDRQPTLQSVTWLLNLRKFGQLDLDPPYQRKSVWSLREKQRFLDTVFRNYPSPAIFLHQTLDEDGNATYHVVDGKQRLSTILAFADGNIRLAKDFGDARFDGANWKDIADVPGARKSFWAYQLTVEFLDDIQEPLVREVFSRLNQNSRKLERQELRHARYDGWFISFVESEAASLDWRRLKVSTTARAKRMADVQLITEFAQALIERNPVGFDQDSLDALCARLDDINEGATDFDAEDFESRFREATQKLLEIDTSEGLVSRLAGSRNNIYSVWCAVADPGVAVLGSAEVAAKLETFFSEVTRVREADREDPQRDRSAEDADVVAYLLNSAGAATEGPQRVERHRALTAYLLR